MKIADNILWYLVLIFYCSSPMPLPLPLSEYPMFLTYILLSLISLFKSYPCVGDLTLPLALLPLWGHTFKCESVGVAIGIVKEAASRGLMIGHCYFLSSAIMSSNTTAINFLFMLTLQLYETFTN